MIFVLLFIALVIADIQLVLIYSSRAGQFERTKKEEYLTSAKRYYFLVLIMVIITIISFLLLILRQLRILLP